MPIELIDETRQFQELELLYKSLKSYLDEKNIKETVTVVLVDDETIKDLNLKDRGINKATDVLSYPMHEPDDLDMPHVEQLGDIFISLDSAQKQATEKMHSLLNETLILAAHGITHLRGFDHDSELNWQLFYDEQSKVLEHKNDRLK